MAGGGGGGGGGGGISGLTAPKLHGKALEPSGECILDESHVLQQAGAYVDDA